MSLSTILITAVNALFPLIITILLGYFLKQKGFLTKEFLRVGNWIVFNICLPDRLGHPGRHRSDPRLHPRC